MFTLKAYKKQKIKARTITNLLPEETVAAFIDNCFLKAVHECVEATQVYQFPKHYCIQKAKSRASSIEGHIYRNDQEPWNHDL